MPPGALARENAMSDRMNAVLSNPYYLVSSAVPCQHRFYIQYMYIYIYVSCCSVFIFEIARTGDSMLVSVSSHIPWQYQVDRGNFEYTISRISEKITVCVGLFWGSSCGIRMEAWRIWMCPGL